MDLYLIILTSQRTKLFSRCLQSVEQFLYNLQQNVYQFSLSLIVIDDSKDEQTRRANQKAIKRHTFFKDIFYFDRRAQASLLKSTKCKLNLKSDSMQAFFHPLGSSHMDIAAHRNLGILAAYSIMKKPEGVLWFIDDDIVVFPLSHNYFPLPWQSVNTSYLVGPKLKGIVDESRVERLLRQAGLDPSGGVQLNSRFLSGGCMFVSFDIGRSIPFPRVYNEDWIFQVTLKQFNGITPNFISMNAYHLPESHSINGNSFLVKREIEGDILLDVVNESPGSIREITKTQINHQINVMHEFFLEHKEIVKHLQKTSKDDYYKIVLNTLNVALKYLKNPRLCDKLFVLHNQYIRSLEHWQLLFM